MSTELGNTWQFEFATIQTIWLIKNFFNSGVIHWNTCHNILERSCFEEGIRYPGGDIRKQEAKSPEECQAACADEEKCLLWTFRFEKEKCFLKHTKKTGEPNSDAVSGPKTCAKGKVK